MEKKVANWLIIAGFVVFLLVLMTASLLRGPETYSFFENRNLAGMPKLTAEGVMNGEYFRAIDSCAADHAPGRNTLLKVETFTDMYILHRPVVNDVVVSDELLLPYNDPDMFDLSGVDAAAETMMENLSSVRDVTEANGGEFYYVGVPCQYAYFREKYPRFLNSNSEYTEKSRAALERALDGAGVNYIDIGRTFEAMGSPEDLGSKVDNHYPMRGAYLAYKTILERVNADTGLGVEIMDENEMELNTLPNRYLGSRQRKLFDLWDGREELTWYSLPDIPFTRSDRGVVTRPYIYDMPKNQWDYATYSFYMGGDMPETVIDTGREGLPRLLIYGDSFTNAVECLMWTGFDEMRSLDLRYYTEKTLGEYIDEYKPDLVICIRDYEALLSPVANGRGAD